MLSANTLHPKSKPARSLSPSQVHPARLRLEVSGEVLLEGDFDNRPVDMDGALFFHEAAMHANHLNSRNGRLHTNCLVA